MGFRMDYDMGGVGTKFRHHLGGNVQDEQFTIVMMTYKRETVNMISYLLNNHNV